MPDTNQTDTNQTDTNQTDTNQTLAQRRAKDALTKIQALQKEDNYGHYKSYVKALPANILKSGLGQAIATVRSRFYIQGEGENKDKDKGKKGYAQLYKHLETWLCGSDEDMPYTNYDEGNNPLLQAIVNHNQDKYIHAQAEALAYLEWLRKFADAFLKDGKGQEDA